MRILSSLVLLLAVAAAAPSAPASLEDVRLGTQVAGSPLSRLDLEGRIVVCYHWCVSCPLSTGAFPYVNRLVEKYAPQGVAIVGFQVRRQPEVAENDVVWYLEHLGPRFPVVRLGWVREWPVSYLPWAVVFDADGKEIFAGHLNTIEQKLDEAIAKSPDPLVGGPYEHLEDRARQIASDRARAGRYLGEIRAIAGREGEAKGEASRILASVGRAFDRQVQKADELESDVERAVIYQSLASTFEGDVLGNRAQKMLEELVSVEGYEAEAAAALALNRARTTFRRLPPPGVYIYHPTEMNYRISDSKPLHARRAAMICDYLLALETIASTWPSTVAAETAEEELFEQDVPEIDLETAKARFARAEALLARGSRGPALHEAHRLLYEATEGYLGGDHFWEKVAARLTKLREERAEDLAAAASEMRGLEASAAALEERIRLGGSVLPRADADGYVRELREIAKRAGPTSALASRIASLADALVRSYSGPAQLGVRFDPRYQGDGVRLGGVYPTTAAAGAGLIPGDVILEFDGKPIGSAEDLSKAIAGKRPGDRVRLKVRRAGGEEVETIEIVLGRKV